MRQLRKMPYLRSAQHLEVAHQIHGAIRRLVLPHLHHLLEGGRVIPEPARLFDAGYVLAGVLVLLRVAALVVLEAAAARMAGGHIGQLVAPLHLHHAVARLEVVQLAAGNAVAERIVQLHDERLPIGRHFQRDGIRRTGVVVERAGALDAGAVLGRRLAEWGVVAAQLRVAELGRIVGGRGVRRRDDGRQDDDAAQNGDTARTNGGHGEQFGTCGPEHAGMVNEVPAAGRCRFIRPPKTNYKELVCIAYAHMRAVTHHARTYLRNMFRRLRGVCVRTHGNREAHARLGSLTAACAPYHWNMVLINLRIKKGNYGRSNHHTAQIVHVSPLIIFALFGLKRLN